ncbi:MAG: LutC/YkgG family protein [Desulfurella sp.]|uniref:LutC/YkgG family protein n=1 Tax=Desulfurella sp. TaxID=1962857 RepID=UPI003C73E1EF
MQLWNNKFSNNDLEALHTFEKKVKAGKGDSVEVYFTDISTARSIFKDIISKQQAKNIIADSSGLTRSFLEESLLDESLNIYFDGDKYTANAADIGISEMEFAIAESGSLVELSDSIWKRLVSAMPSLHIALVCADRIAKDFETAFEILKKHILDVAQISFITGPSITADIERVLTIGVHGPSKLVVFFIKENKQ